MSNQIEDAFTGAYNATFIKVGGKFYKIEGSPFEIMKLISNTSGNFESLNNYKRKEISEEEYNFILISIEEANKDLGKKKITVDLNTGKEV
jgi:hypothetical protein